MENSLPILPMYKQHLPSDAGKVLFSCQARRDPEGEASLTLYDKCLLEVVGKRRQVMVYDFDLRYSFTLSPPSITFEKDSGPMGSVWEKVKFFLESASDLQSCRDILKNKLNQRGFH